MVTGSNDPGHRAVATSSPRRSGRRVGRHGGQEDHERIPVGPLPPESPARRHRIHGRPHAPFHDGDRASVHPPGTVSAREHRRDRVVGRGVRRVTQRPASNGASGGGGSARNAPDRRPRRPRPTSPNPVVARLPRHTRAAARSCSTSTARAAPRTTPRSPSRRSRRRGRAPRLRRRRRPAPRTPPPAPVRWSAGSPRRARRDDAAPPARDHPEPTTAAVAADRRA